MKKPKVFISSTIYDFKDLRSSLKYFLEELGFEVVLSELNDFPINNDDNSFINCIKTLKKCEYFILLIGARIGGFFDKNKKITITMQEYREAYNLFKEEKIGIVTFVRENVWNLKDERKKLFEYLKDNYLVENELSISQINAITNYKSKMMTDAEVIINFLEEITKNNEMKAAIKGLGSFPKGNWVHLFNNFNDIILALKNELNIKYSFRQKLLITKLKNEILDNLKKCYHKEDFKIDEILQFGEFARLNISKSLETPSKMKVKYILWLALFSIFIKCDLQNKYITETLDNGLFLEYDNIKNEYIETNLHKFLEKLSSEIIKIKELHQVLNQGEFSKYRNELFEIGKLKQKCVTIDNVKIVIPLAIYDRLYNIIKISKSIIKKLEFDIDIFNNIKLMPINPFPEENLKLENEYISNEEIIEIIKNDI